MDIINKGKCISTKKLRIQQHIIKLKEGRHKLLIAGCLAVFIDNNTMELKRFPYCTLFIDNNTIELRRFPYYTFYSSILYICNFLAYLWLHEYGKNTSTISQIIASLNTSHHRISLSYSCKLTLIATFRGPSAT